MRFTLFSSSPPEPATLTTAGRSALLRPATVPAVDADGFFD